MAKRYGRPRWSDVRLLLGIVLVLGSVVLGSLVVAHADDRTPMYVARVPLVPGRELTTDSLERVDVQLGPQAGRYLSATRDLGPGHFVLREVPAGELVPSAVLGGRDDVAVQPVTLEVDADSAAALTVGSRVDVYLNRTAAGSSPERKDYVGPRLVLSGVSVASLPRSSGGLADSGGGDRAVQVMAPTDRITEVIGAVDAGARVTVVPVPGSVLRVDP